MSHDHDSTGPAPGTPVPVPPLPGDLELTAEAFEPKFPKTPADRFRQEITCSRAQGLFQQLADTSRQLADLLESETVRTIWGPSLVAVGLEPYQAAVDANLNTVAFLRQALAEIAAAQA